MATSHGPQPDHLLTTQVKAVLAAAETPPNNCIKGQQVCLRHTATEQLAIMPLIAGRSDSSKVVSALI